MSMGDIFYLRSEEMVPNGVTFKVDFVGWMEFDDQKWSLKVTFPVERNSWQNIGKQNSILHYEPHIYHTALHLSGGQRIVFKWING